MQPLDVLYFSLSIGFLILVGFVSYAMYRLSLTLDSLKVVLDDVEDITHDVQQMKNSVKGGITGTFFRIAKLIKRRG